MVNPRLIELAKKTKKDKSPRFSHEVIKHRNLKKKSSGISLFWKTLLVGTITNILIHGAYRTCSLFDNYSLHKPNHTYSSTEEPIPTPEIPKVKNLVEINLHGFWGEVEKEIVANQVIVRENIISKEIKESNDVVLIGEHPKEYYLEGYDESLTHFCYYLHNNYIFDRDNIDLKENKSKYKKNLKDCLNEKIEEIKEKGIKKIILNSNHFHKEPYQLISMKEVGDILNKNNFEFYLRKYSIWDFPDPEKLEPWKNNVKVLCNHKNYLELINQTQKH